MLGRNMAANTVAVADRNTDNRKVEVAAETVLVVSHSLSWSRNCRKTYHHKQFAPCKQDRNISAT